MPNMTARQTEALATVGLLAASADGHRAPSEQEKLVGVFASFGVAGVAGVPARVALGTAKLAAEARALPTPELKQLAWELALGVCHADGAVVERERAFLERLRRALDLPETVVAEDTAVVTALATAIPAAVAAEFPVVPPGGSPVLGPAAERELDDKVRDAAIFAGALELLPQGLATLAIVPLQLKLVADIGTAYGHRIDAGHARELLAAAGLGLSGQAIEGFTRGFLGRLAGRFAGRGVGAMVDAAAGAAATFAATWAIGQVARSWYANDRALDAADVQQRFAGALEDGRAAFDRLQGDVATRAKTIRLPDLAGLTGR
jgi:uncharacterized protein (DUF697 family)/tellurite resistance protein